VNFPNVALLNSLASTLTPSAQAVTQLALEALMEILCAEPASEIAGEFVCATTLACGAGGTGAFTRIAGRTGRALEDGSGIDTSCVDFLSANGDSVEPVCAICCGSLAVIVSGSTELVALVSTVFFGRLRFLGNLS